MESHTSNSLARALSGAHLARSLWVALIVGSVLNAINQRDALIGAAPIQWTKLLLTYCVPFCVATYGTFSPFRSQSRTAL